MVNQQNLIDYFENLAAQHKVLNGGVPGRKAFFFIPVAYNLSEIDKAIRNLKIAPFLALDAMKGTLDDNDSENHTNGIDVQFSILDMATTGDVESIRAARDNSFKIGMEVLARIKTDSRKRNLLTPTTNMRIKNVGYDPIGPMELKYYGYIFHFKITCPFGYTVNSATWLDIP